MRPLCVLKSDILVSFDEAEVKERKPSIGEIITRAIMEGVQEAFPGVIVGLDMGAQEEGQEEAAPTEEPQAAADQLDGDTEATALYARFAALKRAGFTEAQAMELVSGMGK